MKSINQVDESKIVPMRIIIKNQLPTTLNWMKLEYKQKLNTENLKSKCKKHHE